MSHTSTIKAVKIQSISALQATIAELNTKGIRCSLVPNATPRAYFANQEGMGSADFVIKLDDSPYDIGLYKDETGAFEARTDFFGNHINKLLGGKATTPERREQAQMGKLFQLYGVHAAMEQARRKGHTVRRIDDTATDTVKLVLTGAGL